MNTHRKRGFTIIELVIVIAVIAILAAVLVPTFITVVRRARRSADEQTVAGMNLALQAVEIADQEKPGQADAFSILRESGFNVPVEPSSSGYQYYWIAEENRVVLVEMDSTGNNPQAIVYPKELAEKYETLPTGTEWYTLRPDTNECNHVTDKGYRCVPISLVTGGSKYHMVICGNCNKLLVEDAPHDTEGEGGACSKCGFKKETSSNDPCTHSYSVIDSYTSNGDGTHTKICKICNNSDKEGCTFDVNGKCVYCDYQQPADGHKHTYSYRPNNDGTHDRECTAEDCPRQDEATASRLECSYEFDGNVWKCIYCDAQAPSTFEPKGGTEGAISREGGGLYYKNNRLYTGEVDGYNFEYGKLVLNTTGTNEVGGKKYEFNLPSNSAYLTDQVALRFEDNFTNPVPGSTLSGHITFQSSAASYAAVNIESTFSLNIPAAIKMLGEAIESGNTGSVLQLIENIYGIDATFYPNMIHSYDCNQYFKSLDLRNALGNSLEGDTNSVDLDFQSGTSGKTKYEIYMDAVATGNSFTEYLKKTYNVKNLKDLPWNKRANITNSGQWDTANSFYGGRSESLVVGNVNVRSGTNYHFEEPELIYMFWQAYYGTTYAYALSSSEMENSRGELLSTVANQMSTSNDVYKYATENWMEEVGKVFGCEVVSSLELSKGRQITSVKDLYLVHFWHWYYGGNLFNGVDEPLESYEIMLNKTTA